MKNDRKVIIELSALEMENYYGGGIIFKLGAISKIAYCRVSKFWNDYSLNPHSSYGRYAGMP